MSTISGEPTPDKYTIADIYDEVVRRGFRLVRDNTGAAATSNLIESPWNQLETDAARLLNPQGRYPIDAAGQLDIASRLWGQLGYTAPRLDSHSVRDLDALLAKAPESVIVPSPMLTRRQRMHIGRIAAVLSQGQGIPPAISIRGKESSRFATLTQAPARRYYDDSGLSYGVRYHTTEGTFVARNAFTARATKVAGISWLFPVVHLGSMPVTHGHKTAEQLHRATDPSVIPETVLALNALRSIARIPPDPLEPRYITNEAIYTLNRNGTIAQRNSTPLITTVAPAQYGREPWVSPVLGAATNPNLTLVSTPHSLGLSD